MMFGLSHTLLWIVKLRSGQKKQKKNPNFLTQTKNLIKAAIFPNKCNEREKSDVSLCHINLYLFPDIVIDH